MDDEIREENAAAHEESRQQIQMTTEALRRETHEEIAFAHADTRLLFEATIEEMRQLFKGVADGVTMLNEKIDRLDEKVERLSADSIFA